MRRPAVGVAGFLVVWSMGAGAQTIPPALALVQTLLTHERAEAEHKGNYLYLSEERSERTGGHLWTERVAETSVGKVRFLLAEDGKPLSPGRIASERGRLAAILRDQAGFAKREQAQRNDEIHARQMLELLPRAFLFENARAEGPWERIDYRPNPAYQPSGIEEKVLHNVVGSMLIEPKLVRLHELDGHLPNDVSFGFGVLATIHAGSRFATERNPTEDGSWKSTLVDMAVDGRAIFFKTLSRSEHAEHTGFHRLPDGETVEQAVAAVEQ